MDQFASLAVGLFGAFTLLLYLVYAFTGDRSTRPNQWVAAAVIFGAVVVASRVTGPLVGQRTVTVVLGTLCLVASAFLAVRARLMYLQFIRAAISRRSASVFEARTLIGSGDGPIDVGLSGILVGEPQMLGPVSGRPCATFRLEVRRNRVGEPAELVALNEDFADRLVLEDRTGAVELSGPVASLSRGAPRTELVAEGELEAEGFEAPGRGERLMELVRRLDPGLPQQGRWRYRIVERAVLNGVPMEVAGVLKRRAGEVVLQPLGGRLQFSGKELALKMRTASWRAAALAVMVALTGVFWLWP